MTNKEIFINQNSIAIDLINQYIYPYEVLPNIKNYIIELGNKLDKNYELIDTNIWIHKSAKIAKSALIKGPCIIDEYAEIRHCAYIRGNVIIGKEVVLGNSCEIKNAIIFDKTKIPHFNYVGDSIIGYNCNIAAGVILANFKDENSTIKINNIDTNLKKVGSFIGDNVKIGCNAVLSPGCIIKHNTTIYPLVHVRGIIESNSIVKNMNVIIKKR